MTDEDYIKKNEEYEQTIGEDSEESAPLLEWGKMLVEWAEFIHKEGTNPARVTSLFVEADEKLQEALALDDRLVEAYELLVKINFRRAEIVDPDGGEKLKFDASIFAMGAGSALVLKGEIARAGELFDKSFQTIRDTKQVAVIPFIFKLAIDYIGDMENEKYIFAAKRLLLTSQTSGHEEMSLLLRAILDKKLEKPAKPTLAALASYELAKRIVEGGA
jgi:tetratricopeptide (TPR) repeat protein